MRATLEPSAYVLRIHLDGDGPAFGTPYHAAATITVDDLHVATIKGLASSSVFGAEDWRAVFAALAGIGVKELIYMRRSPGKAPRLIRHRVPPLA
jgi:hypothetical protein